MCIRDRESGGQESGGQEGGGKEGSGQESGDGQEGSGQEGSSGQGGGSGQGKPGGKESKGTSQSHAANGGSGSESPQEDLLEQEEANLEHARKATELVLDDLRKQQHNPDPELLRKMKWTQDDLKDFVNRWDELEGRAQSGSAADKRKYDRHLKSLNLKPDDARRTVKQSQNDIQGLNSDNDVMKASDKFINDYNSFIRDLKR